MAMMLRSLSSSAARRLLFHSRSISTILHRNMLFAQSSPPSPATPSIHPISEDLEDAMKAAYKWYMTYLDSFGPDEAYLWEKVETELGTKMIHLKMRCSGIGSEWGKVTLLGTSGLSGSYVEHRA